MIRRGKVVGQAIPGEADQNQLAEMMVGRAVDLELEKDAPKIGDVVLEIKNLEVLDERRQVTVDDVSFDVRAGEILGIAGVQGNGQTELVEALTGLRPAQSGAVSLLGQEITKASPRTDHRIRLGTHPRRPPARWAGFDFPCGR